MTAFELGAGESARIIKLNISGGAKERLISLGISGGAEITSLGFSFFKSSILLSCGAVRVAMRKALAQKIEVER